MPYFSAETRRSLDRLVSAEDEADALERIRGIRALQAALDAEPAVLASVREALSAGRTWDEIADAAGLKPAAAKWRWQGSDDEIAARLEAGRKRSARPSSVPTDLPGVSVTDAARTLGVTAQAVYLRITRGTLKSQTVVLSDGRSYKRVLL